MPLLLVGKTGTFKKKRTLLQFDLSGAGIPEGASVLTATLRLKYFDAVNVNDEAFVARTIQAYEVLVDWDEAVANDVTRTTTASWTAPYLQLGGTGADASASSESSVLIDQSTPFGWQSWNLTALTQRWINGTSQNHGLLLWASNEDVNGYDLRFHSSETTNALERPQLVVEWTLPSRTVYYLKDHLGSIRATVDGLGHVVGYDDY